MSTSEFNPENQNKFSQLKNRIFGEKDPEEEARRKEAAAQKKAKEQAENERKQRISTISNVIGIVRTASKMLLPHFKDFTQSASARGIDISQTIAEICDKVQLMLQADENADTSAITAYFKDLALQKFAPIAFTELIPNLQQSLANTYADKLLPGESISLAVRWQTAEPDGENDTQTLVPIFLLFADNPNCPNLSSIRLLKYFTYESIDELFADKPAQAQAQLPAPAQSIEAASPPADMVEYQLVTD